LHVAELGAGRLRDRDEIALRRRHRAAAVHRPAQKAPPQFRVVDEAASAEHHPAPGMQARRFTVRAGHLHAHHGAAGRLHQTHRALPEAHV
jgi:hypothetical protein